MHTRNYICATSGYICYRNYRQCKYQHANRVTFAVTSTFEHWLFEDIVTLNMSSLRNAITETWIRQWENSPKVDSLLLQLGMMLSSCSWMRRSENGKVENKKNENGSGVGFQNDLAKSNCTAQHWRWFKLVTLSTCRLTHLR